MTEQQHPPSMYWMMTIFIHLKYRIYFSLLIKNLKLCTFRNHVVYHYISCILLVLFVQFSSVPQSCLTLCNPMDCSTPGFLSTTSSRSLLKFIPIKSVMLSINLILCHPLLLLPSIFPRIRVFSNESVLHINGQRIGVSFRLQHQSFQWTAGTDLEWTGWISLQSKGLSRVFSNITVQKHQFFDAQLCSTLFMFNSHIHTWLLEKQ